MSVDWTQPYILIFEWGLFILGWLLVVVLSSVILAVAYAFIRALLTTFFGKKAKKKKEEKSFDQNLKVNRDIYGRFTL